MGVEVVASCVGAKEVGSTGFLTQSQIVNLGGGVRGEVLAEHSEQEHQHEKPQAKHRQLVPHKTAQNNDLLIDDFKVIAFHHRNGVSFSYLAHEILTRGSTILVAISAIMAPMAKRTEP